MKKQSKAITTRLNQLAGVTEPDGRNEMKPMPCDALKIYAFFQVFGVDIYGSKYANIACGKNNISSYFIAKKGWSMNRLRGAIREAKDSYHVRNERSDIGGLYVANTRIKITKQ